MRRSWLGLILFTMLSSNAVFALGMSYGQGDPEKPQSSNGWPVGLSELVNRKDRIGGYFINQSDWFFFVNDTATLNDYLQKFAALKNTTLRVQLLAGTGEAAAPWAKDGDAKMKFDWEVFIDNNAWSAAGTGAPPPATAYTITIRIMLGSQIKLDALKIPAELNVTAGDATPDKAIEEYLKNRKK